MKAWHFISSNLTLRYGDERKVVAGEKLTVDPTKLKLCEYGLHASVKPIDAIGYAPGPIVCYVQLGGKIIEGDDKLVASERTVLWMTDATKALHEFACVCAERVLPQFEKEHPKDKRPRIAIETKRKWLKGEATDEELRAASWASWAASEASRAASRAASEAASWAASEAASWAASEASRAARWAASRAASRAASLASSTASWAAEKSAQNEILEKMLLELREVVL